METKKDGCGRIGTLLLTLLAMVLAGYLACGQALAQEAKSADAPGIFDDTEKTEADAPAAENASEQKNESQTASEEESTTVESDGLEKNDGITNEVRMRTDGTFELHVQNADLLDVLKHLSAQGRVNIIVSKNISGKVTLNLFGVSLMEAIEAVLRSNNLCYRKEGNFVYVYTEKEYEDARKLSFKVFRLSYIQAEDAQKLVSAVLSDKGKITTTPPVRKGIIEPSSDIADQGGGMSHAADEIIVVHDYEDNLKKVEEIIKSIDIMPQQVLLESTILSAELDEDTSLGVNIQALSGASMGALSATSDLTGINFKDANVADLAGHTNGRFNLPFSAQVADGATPMSVGFIYNNTAFFIEMLEKITNTSIIANPKMLVVNKQRGDILIGTQEGYLTTEVSETFTSQKVEFLETGTKLQVRPFIGKDGFVRLEIHPEVSEGSVRILANASEDSPALPTKKTTQITTNVMVKDGHTVVIGGLFRERVKTQRSQVPILGDIPHVGAAFRSTYDQTVREEIIILITPHIVRNTKYEQFSEQIKDEVERARVGMRKSIQWFARSRIADAYINKAKQEIRNNRQGSAMWYLDLALAIEPQEESAIKLKEEITGTPYWSSIPRFSSTQQFVERAIMSDLDLSPNSVQYPTKSLDTSTIPAKARERLGIKPSLDKRLDALYIEKTYDGNQAGDVPQPEPRKPEPQRSEAPVKTAPAAAPKAAAAAPAPKPQVKTAATVKTGSSPASKAPAKPAIAAEPPAIHTTQVAPAAQVAKPVSKPVSKALPSQAQLKNNEKASAPATAAKMNTMMPQRKVKLETAPMLEEPKPVSLKPEVKKLTSQPAAKDKTPQPSTEAKAPDNAESKAKSNWSVWVLWDEDTPISKAE